MLSAMSIIVVVAMIVGIVIISAIDADMPIIVVGFIFDERREKHPHPCRKRRNPRC
ncbi:Hypothetical protein RG1141_PA10950 (plasmid) [Neorhizobium galegae bv. officinalis bv. officinalis str. HAMBI 1141]|uniref:Transmembrane protein n=1 Tax=Neorhizobium galegae bv. officinalis bv. officinalis str. HAMBI 1141 TaxID=1028801 RepID=A0A068THN4_NEOGA|nr:Hypothetical protein RG1141_PA10950 [Neorhizobium galegae bv. officinalis bv. officinalis str. HAMBI 1141]